MNRVGAALLLLASVPAFGGKKVNPDDFKLTASVTSVTSKEGPTTITTTSASRPSYCDNPQTSFQKSYCATVGHSSTSEAESKTLYILTTGIGDKIYELQGARLELGTYKVRCANDYVDFLLTDRKGHPAVSTWKIVGEHQKTEVQSQK